MTSPSNFGFMLVYGDYLKMKNLTVFEPGNGVFSNNGKVVIGPATKAFINDMLAGLSNGNRGTGGTPAPGTNAPPNGVTQQADVNNADDIVNEATAQQIQDQIAKQFDDLSNTPTKTPGETPGESPGETPGETPTTPPETGGDPPPPPDTAIFGYAGGVFLQTAEGSDDDPPAGTLTNLSPNEVGLQFKGDTKAFAGANFILFEDAGHDSQGGAQLTFLPADELPDGVTLPDGGSDDGIEFVGFASNTIPDSITVYQDTSNDPPPTHLATPLTLNAGAAAIFGFTGAGQAFCESCDFLKWGGWGAVLNFQTGVNSDNNPINNSVLALGWWVGGNLATVGQLPLQGTATYTGQAIGSVAAYVQLPGHDYSQWIPYVATGDAQMDWDFAQRAGHLDITNFDQGGPYGTLEVHGRMNMPGQLADIQNTVNKFSGPLMGTLGGDSCNRVTGLAVGSFASNGSDTSAAVIGNWNAGNENYVASGVFGAGRNGAVDPNGQLPPVFSTSNNDGPGYNHYVGFPHGNHD